MLIANNSTAMQQVRREIVVPFRLTNTRTPPTDSPRILFHVATYYLTLDYDQNQLMVPPPAHCGRVRQSLHS